MEAYKFAEQDGYIWCNGICGGPGKLYRDNTKHFDQIVVVVWDQSDVGNSYFNGWVALGLLLLHHIFYYFARSFCLYFPCNKDLLVNQKHG